MKTFLNMYYYELPGYNYCRDSPLLPSAGTNKSSEPFSALVNITCRQALHRSLTKWVHVHNANVMAMATVCCEVAQNCALRNITYSSQCFHFSRQNVELRLELMRAVCNVINERRSRWMSTSSNWPQLSTRKLLIMRYYHYIRTVPRIVDEMGRVCSCWVAHAEWRGQAWGIRTGSSHSRNGGGIGG